MEIPRQHRLLFVTQASRCIPPPNRQPLARSPRSKGCWASHRCYAKSSVLFKVTGGKGGYVTGHQRREHYENEGGVDLHLLARLSSNDVTHRPNFIFLPSWNVQIYNCLILQLIILPHLTLPSVATQPWSFICDIY